MIIGKFISLHGGGVYEMVHEDAADDATLLIGVLSSDSEKFRISALLQPVSGTLQIKQLRIETQK